MLEPYLGSEDWIAALRQYRETEPYNYAVLDRLVSPEAAQALRAKLLHHWGWRRKHWEAQQLYVSRPDLPEVPWIAEQLQTNLPILMGGLELVEHWAILYNNNKGLPPHCDNGAIILNLWLTPDEFNLNAQTGGMVFYDVKRPPSMMVHEFASAAGGCLEHLSKCTKGDTAKVLYKCGRGVLFDGRTFHRSDDVEFRSDGGEYFRLNLSLAFDDPSEYSRRREPYLR